MDNKKQNILIGILVALLVIFSGAWLGLRMHSVQAMQKEHQSQKDLAVAKKQYQKKLKNAEHKYIINYTNASDPVLYDISNQDSDYMLLSNACNNFFKVYWSYGSESDYDARANKLSYLITNNVKNDKSIFNSDKIGGYSVIKEEGQTASFNSAKVFLTSDNGNVIQGVANVNFTVTTDGNGSNHQMRVYQVTYDKQQHKITGVKELQVSGQATDLSNQ